MNSRDLIEQLAAQEQQLQAQRILAPCVPGARLRVRVAGLLLTLRPQPADKSGWAVWRLQGRTAHWHRQARPQEIAAYLARLPARRLIPVRRLRGQSWLAYPLHQGATGPVVLHLAGDLAPLEPVLARVDGDLHWFEVLDRRADPRLAEGLREALAAGTRVTELRLAGLSPEFRNAYALAWKPPRKPSAAQQLRRALATGAGQLADFQDRGEHWWVAWRTPDGAPHHSLIDKNLGVVSAGICLSGEDDQFDLSSLVGVVEQAPDWV